MTIKKLPSQPSTQWHKLNELIDTVNALEQRVKTFEDVGIEIDAERVNALEERRCDVSKLSEAVKLYLKVNSIGTRQVADETGMSHATISRFLNGKNVDSQHFLAIINWLFQPEQDRQLNKMQVKYEEMSQAEYESSMRSYIEELDYILGGLTGQPQTEEHNQQWLEARQSIINLIVKSIGEDEVIDSTENSTYGPKSVRNRLRAIIRTKWTLEDEKVYFFEPLEKEISVEDMQKIVDANEKLVKELIDGNK